MLGSTGAGPPMPPSFNPQFDFMAYHVGDYPDREFRFGTCQAEPSVESVVRRCLERDELLGLSSVASSRAEACCLVTPPGHAILDTGCTSTLVGSDNERRWNEELRGVSGGSLVPECGHSETRFEGINGESKASYTVKYPVRVGSQDGYVQASVIPGKAPFLLSTQALRQMKAKLDCERDVLEVPGIGAVKLTTNQVGHYLLPLFQFGYHTAEDPSFATEGEYENLTRPPGLEGPSGVQDQGSGVPLEPSMENPLPSKTGSASVVVAPTFESVSGRSGNHARISLLRLARETRGPWVLLPQELDTIYSILGRDAFDDQKRPWQVRAAQIGYKARVVRRPPPALSGHDVWTFALSFNSKDRVLGTVMDWAPCHACSGKVLENHDSEAHMFLFVFASRPNVDASMLPSFPDMNMTAKVPEGPRDVKTVFLLMDDRKHEFNGLRARNFQLPPRDSGIAPSELKTLLEEYDFSARAACVRDGQGDCTVPSRSAVGFKQQALVAETHVVRCTLDQAISDTEQCAFDDSDAYESCTEGEDDDWVLPRQMRPPTGPREFGAARTCSLLWSSLETLRKQTFHHLSL